MRLLVVGGGVTGLSGAHAAIARARERGTPLEVTLVERGMRLGGNLRTERAGGFLLDAGPDSWVASKPQATALARELGLGDALVGTRPDTRRYLVAHDGALHPVPEGLVLGIPTRLLPLAGSRLFSWGGKLRMALEPFVPARAAGPDDDESIGAFAARRLGKEAADRLVAPLLGGISAGDADDISIAAAFPQMVTMERQHGSLVKAMRAAARARAAAPKPAPGRPEASSAFVTLAQGTGGLATALADALVTAGVRMVPGVEVTALRGRDGAYEATLSSGDVIAADRVLFAAPAYAAARVLAELDPEVVEPLAAVPFGSTATVFLGYRRQDVPHPLDAVGFVVPRSAGRPLLASTWVSSKWEGRAPEGHVLLRAFFGGAWGESVLARDDEALVDLARHELGQLMSISAPPVLSKVYRFERATAQMRVGHLGRMRAVKDRLATTVPGVRLAGGGYEGFGIPDCIRQATEAARALVDS